ncbi:MAG: hypothetical protein GY722_14000 [bacterium]|nr:hypothetical protein [bacterium]
MSRAVVAAAAAAVVAANSSSSSSSIRFSKAFSEERPETLRKKYIQPRGTAAWRFRRRFEALKDTFPLSWKAFLALKDTFPPSWKGVFVL